MHFSWANWQRGANGQPSIALRYIGRRARNGRQFCAFFVQGGNRPLERLAVGMFRLNKSCAVGASSRICPAYITMTRSQKLETIPMSCVIRMTAVPRSCCILRIKSRICAWTVTSSAVVGSSAIRISGWAITRSQSLPAGASRRKIHEGKRASVSLRLEFLLRATLRRRALTPPPTALCYECAVARSLGSRSACRD